MSNSSLHKWLGLYVQVIYALLLGACFLVGEAISNWGLSLFLVAFIALLFGEIEKTTTRDKALIAVLVSFYLYFGARAWAVEGTIFNDFSRENLVFLYAPFILLMFRHIDVDWVFDRMIQWLIPLALIAFVIAFYQARYMQIERVAIFAQNTLSLSMYITIGVYLSLANYQKIKMRLRWALALVWLMGWYVILDYSESRLAGVMYPSFIGIFFSYAFCSFDKPFRDTAKTFGLITFATAIILALLLTFAIHYQLSARLEMLVEFLQTGGFAQDNSAGYRVEMWSLARQHISEVPAFGLSSDRIFYLIWDDWSLSLSFPHLHNELLNLYVAGGFIGLIFYVLLTFWPLHYFWSRSARNDRFAYFVTIIFVVIFTNGLFNRVIFHQERTAWYVLALVFMQIYFGQLAKRSND